ncbi:LysR family transcriptional regulator [Modestobacter roseus]|uniref:DNA-binding transcriptional LysR family regulator n=1 Tax=Modestobacter roseus TaxID=1181884 RepID=A0A562IWV7_9ACTN|nr:LysR family transcriptional regulator [Modestobacter roseus]MQA34749.1 LysR family transcriptional regulator [Modestobacter roseus]TWH75085.1 DNA-binding transcriptional LysR family regulator [Modestobacter roseus]
MDDLETRELRHVIAVAENLHFSRAAAELHIAQPALTKSIRRIESRLGVQLFVRTSRSVSLTPAGRALLEHGRIALTAVTAAVDRARDAARSEHLRLVIKPGGDGNLLSGLLAAFAQTPFARPVDVLFSAGTDRHRHLVEDRADVALLYVPSDDTTGLEVRTLVVEDRLAVVSEGDALAGREHLTEADLHGLPMARWSGRDPDGTGPEVADLGELISLVRLGRAVTVLPRSLIAGELRGIATVPVVDAEPSRLAIGRRADDDRPVVHAFIAAAERSVRSSAGVGDGRAPVAE